MWEDVTELLDCLLPSYGPCPTTPDWFDNDVFRDLEYGPALPAGLTVLEVAREAGLEDGGFGRGGISSGVWLNLSTRSFNDPCLDFPEAAESIGVDFVVFKGDFVDDMDAERCVGRWFEWRFKVPLD